MSSPDQPTALRILEATRRLLVTRGAGQVRLEDIAKAAGVSRQTLYLRFGNRNALFVETAKYVDEQERIDERVRPYREAPDARSALREFIRFWATYIPVVYPLAAAFLAAQESDAAARAAWGDRMAAVRSGCALVVRRLQDERLLDSTWSVEQAVDLLFSLVSTRTWELLTRDCGWSNEAYVSRMMTVVERALLATA